MQIITQHIWLCGAEILYNVTYTHKKAVNVTCVYTFCCSVDVYKEAFGEYCVSLVRVNFCSMLMMKCVRSVQPGPIHIGVEYI